jgi:hypothetical protein
MTRPLPGDGRKAFRRNLAVSTKRNLAIVDVWAGSAELTIPDVRGEDMHSLAPLRIGRGYRLGMSYSVTDRSADYKREMLKRLWSLVKAATGAPDVEIVLGIQEVPSSQAMEMGQIMPDVASS